MKVAAVVVAMLVSVTAAQAQERIGSAPYLVLSVGSGIDLVSTLHVIESGRGREGNPILARGGTAGLALGKVTGTAVIGWGMQRLAKAGHPRAAKWIGYAAGVGFAGIGIRNTQVGR